MIEVNVVSQHSGSEAFPIKRSLGTIFQNASVRGTLPTLSVFTCPPPPQGNNHPQGGAEWVSQVREKSREENSS
jgi:hypothetical protein